MYEIVLNIALTWPNQIIKENHRILSSISGHLVRLMMLSMPSAVATIANWQLSTTQTFEFIETSSLFMWHRPRIRSKKKTMDYGCSGKICGVGIETAVLISFAMRFIFFVLKWNRLMFYIHCPLHRMQTSDGKKIRLIFCRCRTVGFFPFRVRAWEQSTVFFFNT